MTDPDVDDEALSWAGDDRLQAGGTRGPRPARVRARRDPSAPQGGLALVLLGVLGGIALLETLGWIRSVTSATMAATISGGTGDPVSAAGYAINVIGRVAAVAAAPLWFVLAAWRIRTPSRRLAWLVLGAVVLVPWPALLGLL
jgi:hypothetical protein